MTKVDKVKEKIIETSLYLFNTNGITYTSIQDIMTATELSKGAIYRRFKNKEEIVLAAYDKSGEIMWNHFHKAMENKKTAIDKILAIFLVYQDAANNPLLLEAVHYLIAQLKVLEYFQNYKKQQQKVMMIQ